MPSKTVLGIFILVVANNSALDLFATTGTLSYPTSYLLCNKRRGDRGIRWPIISRNDLPFLLRDSERRLLHSCRCFCNIQWLLSGRGLNSNLLWGCIGGHGIQVSSRALFKQAKKFVFVLGNYQAMMTEIVSATERMGKWFCHFCNILVHVVRWIWNTIHQVSYTELYRLKSLSALTVNLEIFSLLKCCSRAITQISRKCHQMGLVLALQNQINIIRELKKINSVV